MRQRLTKMTLEQRPPVGRPKYVRDTDSPLVLRITPAGNRTLYVRPRIRGAKGNPLRIIYPKSAIIGNLGDARLWAHNTVDVCRAGTDPRQKQEVTDAAVALAAERTERLKCKHVIQDYLERRLRREKKNRTADKVARMFEVFVTPKWGERPINGIDRKDVNDLLNDVFDRKVKFEGRTYGGNVAADRLLAQIRACFAWYQLQDGNFTSPVVPGMARTSPRARKRSRVLSDEEIRALWPILPDHGTFGAIVQSLMLTAQRLREVADMSRSEIDANGVWTIPAARYNTNMPNVVPLSPQARAVIEAQRVFKIGDKDCELVFTTNGTATFGGYSKCKDRLDKALLEALRDAAERRGDDVEKVALSDWRLHDLRRTGKTLMMRAGVRPDISERVLGHIIPGVEGVYDQHDYIAEKKDALEKLAGMIGRIITPPARKVVQFKAAVQ